MTSLARYDALDVADQAEIRTLAAAVERQVGAPPLSDRGLLQLAEARPGLLHIASHDGPSVTAYAQLDGYTAEIVGQTVPDEMLATVEDAAGRELTIWAHGQHSPVLPVAEARGYRRVRELWQLRRPAAAVPPVRLPDGVTVRPFRVGVDEDAWLAVNAAAFASHPEQGRWTRADLDAREREPWFDPAGFLLAWRGGELLGFHWTKVHPDGLGEVYVLGVSPAAQGMRLGAALLAAGLEHLTGRGVLLYVDGDNSTAMRLYEKYGFERYDLDVQLHRAA